MNRKDIDSTVFSKYTVESCYWAGFLAADGHIDSNGTIGLELKDLEPILAFKKFCSSEHNISHNVVKGSYRIRFVDKQIYEDIIDNFSITVDKTFNLRLPLLSTNTYYASYFRGFFDGDGCLTEFFNNRPTASFRVFLTSGSLSFLEESLELLREINIIKGGSIHKKASSCWHIQLAIQDSTSFLNWIYSTDGYRLVRKYEKYHKLIVLGDRAHL